MNGVMNKVVNKVMNEEMNKVINKMVKFMTLVSATILTLGAACPLTSYAAGKAAIRISEEIVRLDIGGTTVLNVDYEGLLQGAADIAALSSDSGIVAASIVHQEDGGVSLAISGSGLGTATIAVYSASDVGTADYVVVQSGMAAEGEIINKVDGRTLTVVYDDKIIRYHPVLEGKNGAQLAVTSLVLERERGVDCLKISGELLAKDSKMPGMTVFYINCYDAAGGLMKRQAVYARDPSANNHLEFKWYLPEGCVRSEVE